jgi:hypothetical protein
MRGANTEAGSAPEIAVEQRAAHRAAGGDGWFVTWRITNRTSDLIQLDSAWLPHGQFRGERTEMAPALALGPARSADLEMVARWDEAASVVENAFLIVTGEWRDERWRILVRLTIRQDEWGAPHATMETTTVQRVGFSAPGT